MTSPVTRRLIKLQRQIHKTVRADVRRVLGPQTPELKRYYEAYKREFRVEPVASSKEVLLKECLRSNLILLGDYHTFPQSQKTALRLLREIVDPERELMLCIEMVPTTKQNALDDYMAGRIADDEFLKKIDYASAWGFPWPNFKPLLAFAKEHNIPVIALNHESEDLSHRDQHAAALLAAVAEARPKAKLFVIYGDLHLARNHIPKKLKASLLAKGLRKHRVLTIFQNSESVYWKLARAGLAHAVDVVELGRGRFCIMNAAPWVKLQSYLEWAESAAVHDPDDEHEPNLHEAAHERLRNLAEALGLELPAGTDFTIQLPGDFGFLSRLTTDHALSRDEAKSVKILVLGNRNALIPSERIIYLASGSMNALNESVAMFANMMASGRGAIFYDPRAHFFHAALSSALSYFGSKILNHKRKCDMEDDYKLLLERKLGRKALPQEKTQRKVAKLVLAHLDAQRAFLKGERFQTPKVPLGPSRRAVFLEASRAIGMILGERLYVAFSMGHYELEKIKKLYALPLETTKQARDAYLELVGDLGEAPLLHTSKQDLL